MDVAKAEVVVIIGANPTVNHPVAATWIKNAVKNGTKLVLLDPRKSELARHAHRYLQFKPDTDVAMLNAMMHVIVHEGLVDEAFIASRTIGYDELKKNVEGYSPEAMAPICGIDAETLKYVPRLDDPVGHGRVATRARHRQRALPHRTRADDGPDRPPGHRPAPAARAEQRARRVRRGPHPDDVPGLPARGHARRAREVRESLGHEAGLARHEAGPDRRRSDACDQGGHDQGHVRRGREPGDVRPRREPRARIARRAGAPRGAGHLLHGDGLPRRRRPARARVPR